MFEHKRNDRVIKLLQSGPKSRTFSAPVEMAKKIRRNSPMLPPEFERFYKNVVSSICSKRVKYKL